MKVYIIAIQRHELSLRAGHAALASAHAYGYEAEIFNAYTGHNGRRYLESQRLKLREGQKPHSLGSTGCFASHHRLWRMCASLDTPIVIAEHDALFVRSWPNPSWQDVLHLNWEGSSVRHTKGFDRLGDAYAPCQDDSVYRHGFEPYDWPGWVTMSCNYAYALKPSAARLLLEDAREHGWFYADRIIREPLVTIETIHPAIAVEQEIALTLSLTKGRGAD
ncbi:MAG TPA: glycosyltransferase family 25 protein [Rubrivivax sp.]|nr:glycosyltransferase family 25 protein [Rubrivivax sp.]